MNTRNTIIFLALLIAGLALVIWGFDASESFSSGVSKTFQGAPSNKSIVLLVGGGLLSAVGIVGLVRGSRAA
jgi:hypothetical protein